jgi:hypothetical protein
VRLRWSFLVLSLALLASVAAAVVKELRVDWRVWQERFAELEGARATAGDDGEGASGRSGCPPSTAWTAVRAVTSASPTRR